MTGKFINGKEIAANKKKQIKEEVSELIQQGIQPGLAVILVGDNPASKTYVSNKQKACREVGIDSFLFHYDDSISEDMLVQKIQELNNDSSIHGILVQLPLPKHIDTRVVINTIHPNKDVDGFHPINVGNMMTGNTSFTPCTPLGVMEMLKSISYSVSGKHAVVIGRSNIVGKPMGQLLLQADATVTYCHSKTKDLKNYTSQADIIISAVGKAKFITADYVKKGAVVIDVGMNRDENGKLCGDVDTNDCLDKVSYITPVPGGVGPMTITMLLANTLLAAKKLSNV